MSLRAVLFDVGGPLNTEVTHEQRVDAFIRAEFEALGLTVSDEQYDAAAEWAVQSYAWDVHPVIIWRLSGGDVALCDEIHRRFRERPDRGTYFELRVGMASLLEMLHGRGVLLGLAANQPVSAISTLDELGLGHFFRHRQVSDSHGFHKPDPRLFLAACADLAVDPSECVMVGDRIDNDIAPARALGMKAILFRTGRHRGQMPRSWYELPDAEVATAEELRLALDALLTG